MNPKKVVEKFTASHRRNVAAAGPFLRNGALGTLMAEMVEKSGAWPSVVEVIEEVRERIARTPSASGHIDVADDIARAPLEQVLLLLARIS